MQFEAPKCNFKLFGGKPISLSPFPVSSLLHYLLPFAFILLASCATEPHTKHVVVAPELRQQVDDFSTEAAAHGINLPMNDLVVGFSNMNTDEMIGYCWTRPDSTPEVSISLEYWQTANDSQREMLMFHELGHCLLGRHHNDTINLDGMPNSIMNWCMFDAYYYETYRENYLQELFGHDRL